jgi:hypothetical protein
MYIFSFQANGFNSSESQKVTLGVIENEDQKNKIFEFLKITFFGIS